MCECGNVMELYGALIVGGMFETLMGITVKDVHMCSVYLLSKQVIWF